MSPQASWGSPVSTTTQPLVEAGGPLSCPRQERQRDSSNVMEAGAQTDSSAGTSTYSHQLWPPGSPPLRDILFLAAGPVPGTEKQAAGDQVELHAATEVLLEQHRAPFRGLHLHPSEAAGLLDRGPRPTGIRVPLPPRHAGGLQEKVSLPHCYPAGHLGQAT